MKPEIGHTLMHPRHGAVTVRDFGVRQVRGTPVEVVTLTVNSSDMRITIPVESLDTVGLREPIDSHRVDEVLHILTFSTEEFGGNWSRRFKAYEAKLATGDVRATAHVVRSLSRRQRESRISPGEQRLLSRARSLLVDELVQHPSFSSPERVHECIDEALNRSPVRDAT